MRRIVNRAWSWSVIAAAGLACLSHSLAAQETVATTPKSGVSDTDVRDLLARRVTFQVANAPLREAVKALAAQANVLIGYRREVLDATGRMVTLNVKEQPLGSVLGQLLAGTKLYAVVTAPGVIALKLSDGGDAAANGIVTGLVTDAATKRPVAGAIVTIDSGRTVKTQSNGRFTLSGVPAGVHKIVVRTLGYRVYSAPVTVRDDASEMVTIALTPSATTLTDVVTTATGDRKRLEVGNAVGTIKADSIVATNLIRNVSDLLQARIPGVLVQNTDGAVGAPSRIRLRGVSSLALNNDPIVILDGVRLNAQTTIASNQTNVGSQQMLAQKNTISGTVTSLAPSRLDDIDPNIIESIDVLRGPSASSLYGTDAANGVIVIKTKRGQPGSWRASITGDNGWSFVPGKFPELWWGYYMQQSGNFPGVDCLLATGGHNVANGSCVQDSVRQFNPQNDSQMRTVGTGTNQSVSASLSGGSTNVQQFLSIRATDNVGMARMSPAEQRNIARLWNSPPPSWMKRPNTEQDLDGTANTVYQITPQSDIALTTGALYRNVLNSGSGVQSVGLFAGASPNDTLAFLPSESQKAKLTSAAKRGFASGVGNYRPFHWLHLTGTVGGDYTLRTDGADTRAQDCTAILAAARGTGTANVCQSSHANRRDETFVTTVNGGANLTFSPLRWLMLTTSLGEQYSHTRFYSLLAGNADGINCPLAFGTSLLTPTPVCVNSNAQRYTVTENQDEAATAGWYIEETVSMFGLYTTFGRRYDVASAFGGQVKKSPPDYPKFNFSFPLSAQSFFPQQPWVSSLRLRLAYGQSGNQASQTAVINGFRTQQVVYGNSTVVTNLITLNQLGNPDLRPERGTEWEGGFDISFLADERLHFEATMSRKFTRDAIVQIQRPLSYGVDNVSEYVNLGNVENRSLELMARLRLLDTRAYTWELTINRTQTSNKLVHKAPGYTNGGPTDNNNFTEGYPLYGLWGVPVLSYMDANGDGILSQKEIVFGAKQYMGAPYPTSEMVYANDISFLNRALHVSATFDQVNGLSNLYAVNGQFLRGAVDRTAPLDEQAAWIQATLNNSSYVGRSTSLRLNDLSVSYTLPARLTAQLLHAHALTLTLAGRNLALWTTYAGKDPNVDTSLQLGDGTIDDGTGLPQPRSVTLRFNLGL